MKKIKTLIVIDNLNTGGIASSLFNFINASKDNLDISLYVFDNSISNMQKIDSTVTFIKHSKILNVLGSTKKALKKQSKILYLYKAILTFIAKITSGQFARKFVFLFAKKVRGFEYAISFAQDNGWHSLSKGCNDFVIRKVDAKYKSTFVHCDYKNYGGYHKKQERMYSFFDSINNVSLSCKKNFDCMFPNLSNKTIVLENFINVNDISHKSIPPIKYDDSKVNFLSVCRISSVKGLDHAIEAFCNIYNQGHKNFSWTIVGDGPELDNLLHMVKKLNLIKHVFFVGNKDNPYPFFPNASVFLLPSIHEAAPMVFGESIVNGLPILTTNTCSAVELVKERKVGLVVENSIEEIEKGIMHFINNEKCFDRFEIKKIDVNLNATKQLNALLIKVQDKIYREEDNLDENRFS